MNKDNSAPGDDTEEAVAARVAHVEQMFALQSVFDAAPANLAEIRARYMDGLISRDEAFNLAADEIPGWFSTGLADRLDMIGQCIDLLPQWLFDGEAEEELTLDDPTPPLHRPLENEIVSFSAADPVNPNPCAEIDMTHLVPRLSEPAEIALLGEINPAETPIVTITEVADPAPIAETIILSAASAVGEADGPATNSEVVERQEYIDEIIADALMPQMVPTTNGLPKLGKALLDGPKAEAEYRTQLAALSLSELREKAVAVTSARTRFTLDNVDAAAQDFLRDTVLRESLRVREGVLSVTADVWDSVVAKIFESVGYSNAGQMLERANYARQALGYTRIVESYSRIIRELANLAGIRVPVGVETNDRGIEKTRYEIVTADTEYTFEEMLRIAVSLYAHYSGIRRASEGAVETAAKLRLELTSNLEDNDRYRRLVAQREKEIAELRTKVGMLDQHPIVNLPDDNLQYVIRHVDYEDRYLGLTRSGKARREAGKALRTFDYIPVLGLARALKLDGIIECRTVMDQLTSARFYRRIRVQTEGEMKYGIFRLVLQDYGS